MKMTKRILSFALCLVMLVGLMPATVFAVENNTVTTGNTTYVLAGSDFQARNGHDAGATIVSGLLEKIKVDYSTMDGFLFAGDYDVNYNDSANGQLKLQQTVQGVYGTDMDEVYVQGNHDADGLVGSNCTPSGANDTSDYGVFVINEKDYMWYNNDEATIKRTAQNLEVYLNAKRNAGYTAPIFVISHLPLHYCMRTRSGGNDGMHANYIFDVLNEAGNAGLNIIFMFGHNHSHGWDDYLGGAAIFLTKGDKINIAQNSTTVFQEETLAFTYMNAGYVGYYGDSYTSTVDKTLTMTTFVITDTEVEIRRYDSNGMHNLKSAGVYNVEYPDSGYYSTDTSTVASPYMLTLNTEITPAGTEVEAPDSGTTTTGRTYTRVTSTSELVSGGQYLIIENGNTDYFMLPESISNDAGDRVGYNIESTTVAGGDTITGEYQAKEWTMTGSGTSWVLSTSAGSAYMEYQSSSRAYGRISSSNSSTITIGGSANAFTFTTTTNNTQYVFDHSSAGMINGYVKVPSTVFYIYRLTNEGSSAPTVEATGGNWVTITEPTQAGTKYVYVLDTDGIDTGVEYLIVANSYAKALSAAASSNNAVDITIDGNYAYATSDTYGWTFTRYGNGVYYIGLNGSVYLRLNKGALGSSDSTGRSRRWTVTSNNDGSYDIVRDGYNLRWSNSNGVFQASNSNEGPVRLYKYVKTETTTAQAGLYGKVSGELTYNVAIGTSAADALAAVKAGIDILYHTGDANAAQTFPDDGEGMTWTLDPSYDGTTPGEYAVTIAYNGVTLGVAKVVVPSVAIEGYAVEPAYGTVNKGSSQAAQTGALIYVQLEGDKYYTVPVTVDMLTKADGSAVSTGEQGTIEHLTLTYNGVKITENFTLNVVAKTVNNYPEYPNEGAVKVNKTATGIDFQSSGVAQIELSASGVPVKKGADVIVMLDLSSSMETNKINGVSRLQILRESMTVLMNQLQADDKDGKPMDIRIAVADFHRYYPDSSSPYYINSADHLTGGSIRTNAEGTNKVYTGTGGMGAGAFVDVHDLANNAFETTITSNQYYLDYKSGTNYDYAFDAIYQLGEAITTQNATDGVERDLFVIFMSDGAPFQYNYFSAQSGSSSSSTDARYWNNWLQGTMTDAMFDSNARNDYYNEDGKHWMAEAIKGNPASTYPVIRKNNAADTDGDNWVNVNGLGAKMYSIGFCLAADKEITVASMQHVIRNAASSDQYYFEANSASDLGAAFSAIGADIAYAANNARFVDQMGNNFNLQMTPIVDYAGNAIKDGNGNAMLPSIEIISYDIWTRADYEANKCTIDQIGVRKGTRTVLETVTFTSVKNTDGSYTVTGAYSDQIGGGATNILADGTQTGYVKGVIYAKTFIYNTNVQDVAVDGVNIPTGIKNDGTTAGSTNVLPSETFYWKMGTVQISELAMRYYVYLDGSMEGTKPAGSYATNNYAILYYDNYLGNSCLKETVSPVMAWKSANVSYAFYLVNEKGEIIVNQTTGETGTFANKIAVTNPVVYREIMLNNTDQVQSIEVAAISGDVLPKYYTLYDEGAEYEIHINSDATGNWAITKGGVTTASTYVTNYTLGTAYSNVLTEESPAYDYTHTIVWFAVVWTVEAHPDSVVVDFGLPVDISVLANDMFGDYGKLAGVGAYVEGIENITAGASIAAGLSNTTYTGTYGVAEILTDDGDNAIGKIRYTMKDMQMNGYEKFAYAVQYTGNENAGYYYDTVTVIPATTIYYEDSFVALKSYTWSNGWTEVEKTDDKWVWSQEGTTVDGTQNEDRPGKYSLTVTDFNNIYGYDNVNKGMTTYSMGSALKATVDYDNYAEARFTFYGTGFDIISMTNNTTGTIYVDVYQVDVDQKEQLVEGKSFIVDTYYGYHQVAGDADNDGTVEEGELVWEVNPDAKDSIYQVPVMKVDGLPYGQYTVKITVFYSPAYDNVEGSTDYAFYLDAIRIYDPANDGAADGSTDTTIEDAYLADGEGWPEYKEVRNLLLDANALGGTLGENQAVTGVVFIDGDAEVGQAQIEDYKNFGPNNEVYLAPGQRIAFKLSVDNLDNIASVHIGLKNVDKTAASYTILNIEDDEKAEGSDGVNPGEWYGPRTDKLDTTTDMYYDMTEWCKNDDIIVISNYNADTATSGVLSITNIKITYKENPNGEQKATVMSLNTVAAGETQESGGEAMVYMTPRAAMLTLRAVNTMYLPEIFEPEQMEVSVNRDHVKEGDKVKVTVKSSDDVAYITVNGEAVTRYKTNRRTGVRTWEVTLKAEEAGEMNVEVVAYDADDLASDPVVQTVTVEAKKDPKQVAKEILKGLLGRFFG